MKNLRQIRCCEGLVFEYQNSEQENDGTSANNETDEAHSAPSHFGARRIDVAVNA